MANKPFCNFTSSDYIFYAHPLASGDTGLSLAYGFPYPLVTLGWHVASKPFCHLTSSDPICHAFPHASSATQVWASFPLSPLEMAHGKNTLVPPH